MYQCQWVRKVLPEENCAMMRPERNRPRVSGAPAGILDQRYRTIGDQLLRHTQRNLFAETEYHGHATQVAA